MYLLEGATPASLWIDVRDEAKSTCFQSWCRTSNTGSGCREGKGGIHPEICVCVGGGGGEGGNKTEI